MTRRVRKAAAVSRDLVLRVSLREVEPEVWRRVRVPDGFSLHDLHEVLQFVFGWLSYHLYDFRIGERRFETPDPEAEGEERLPAVDDDEHALPALLGGEGAAPPEDCGGPGGFEHLRAALADPAHPEHAELRERVGPLYDPERFDPWLANQNLTLAMAMRRFG